MNLLKNHYRYRNYLFAGLFVLLCNSLSAQNEFYKMYGNPYSNSFQGIRKTENDSYLITGYTYNTFFDGGMLCAKIDSNGNLLWSKMVETDYSWGLTIFEMNNKIFIGGTNDYTDNGDMELTCLDSEGNVLWIKGFDSGENEDVVTISNVGNDLVMVGNTLEALGTGQPDWDILFMKTDISGNLLLSKKIGTGFGDSASKIIKCSDESGFLIIGHHSNYTTDSDAFIIKTDNDGEVLWSYRYGGDETEVLNDGVETEDGNFIFTGKSHSFGNISNDGDIWVLGIDPMGNILFSRNYGKYGTDRGYSIVKTSAGSYIITGETLSYGNPQSEAFILQIDSEGEAMHFETFGEAGHQYGRSVVYNSDNTITIGGRTSNWFGNNNDFFVIKKELGSLSCNSYTNIYSVLNNPTPPERIPYEVVSVPAAVTEYIPVYQESVAVLQTDNICPPLDVNDFDSPADTSGFLLYPNPAADMVTISSLDPDNPVTEVYCYDILSKKVIHKKQTSTDISLNIENLPKGIYIAYIISQNGNTTTKKIVKK